MTQIVEKAIAELTKLAPDDQEAFARWMLEELEDEERWQRAFDQSADLLAQLADEALAEHRAGNTEVLIPADL
jgi:hypothetical protein